MATDNDPNVVTNGGLFVEGEISSPTAHAPTPGKAMPTGRLERGEEFKTGTQNICEIYQEVDSASLAAYRSDDESIIEREMEDKLPAPGSSEIVFCFWSYTDSFPISRQDMKTIVELSERYSDVITPPLQHPLLRAILYEKEQKKVDISEGDSEIAEADRHDFWDLYMIGIKRFLETAEGAAKAIMGMMPFNKDREDEMVSLLEMYDGHGTEINMLCFNLHRRKPTNSANNGLLQRIIGNMKRLDMFSTTLKYAINIRHYYRQTDSIKSAEDLALAGMGFDVIGENHWRPQSDFSKDWEMKIRIFDTDIMAYREARPIASELEKIWPDDDATSFSIDSFLNAESDDELRRLQKLINAEQLELALSELREKIELDETEEFIQSNLGTEEFLSEGLQAMAENYEDPRVQSSLGKF